MEVSEILANEEVAAALGEDGINAISSLAQSNALLQTKLNEAEGKIGGITEQKKKAQAQHSELLARIEELESSKLSRAEKIEREKAKAEELLANREKELKELQENMARRDRTLKLKSIATDLHFLDSVDSDTQTLLLDNAFKDVDLESPDTVNAVLSQFKERNKPFLRAEVASGTGTKGEGANTAPQTMELTPEAIRAMSPEDFQKNADKLWAQANKEAMAS
jgi:chromosome segregation ATPase